MCPACVASAAMVVGGVTTKNEAGEVFHTYSSYARGLDAMVSTYNWLDIAPKGRDEDGLAFSMAWVRHHDRYEDSYILDAKQEYVQPEKASDFLLFGEEAGLKRCAFLRAQRFSCTRFTFHNQGDAHNDDSNNERIENRRNPVDAR